MLFPPLREYWRAINREERAAQARLRTRRRATDKGRPTCRCPAYPFPHRPGGGLCCWPNPPLERWQSPGRPRLYRHRYLGLRRQIARANGLHPIKDRATIDALLPGVLALAKELKRRCSRIKYRNMAITDTGLTGYYTSAGPTM